VGGIRPKHFGQRYLAKVGQDVGKFAAGRAEVKLSEELHQWQQQRVEAGEGGGECGPRIEGS